MSQLFKKTLVTSISVLALLGFNQYAAAQSSTPLSAQNSDPEKLGWMQGFPPVKEKLIMQPQSDYFSFPKLRWTVCHLRELLPTKQVSSGIGNVVPFKYSLDNGINGVNFTPLNSDKQMTWQESLSANYTDGILILHKGEIVYEKYAGCLNETGKHAAMSMTKSLTGLLAETLIAQGQLDSSAKVAEIIPELAKSGFGRATVR